MTNETKIGMLVVFCVVASLFLSSLMGNINLFGKKGFSVTFLITDASGLVPNAKVKYRGMEVGKVLKISFQNDTVVLDSTIDNEFQIPDNVAITVSQNGLMGEKFINLSLQEPVPSSTFLKEGGVYRNYAPPATIEELASKLVAVIDDVKLLTESLKDTFASAEGKQNMQNILKNVDEGADTLNRILAENQANIKEITESFSKTAKVLGELSTSKERELYNIVDNIHDITVALNSFSTKIDRLLDSEEDNIKVTLGNLKNITGDMQHTVDNLNNITSDLRSGKGTLGMLVSDNDTRDEIKDAIYSISSMMDKANKISIILDSDAQYLARHSKTKGSFTARIVPSPSRYYLLGVSNKPLASVNSKYYDYTIEDPNNPGNKIKYRESVDKYEKNTLAFSVQYGLLFREHMFGIRGGIFDSTLGFGLDYYPFKDERLTLTMEALDFFRDKHGVLYRGNVKFRFLDNFYVQAGWDDINSKSRNSFSVGGGVYFSDSDIKHVISNIPLPN